MSSPKVWGRYFWTTLHLVALGYPDNPTREDIHVYQEFYTNFGKILPCKKCMRNYERHLLELPITRYMSSRDALFTWTVNLHNIVNKEQKKSEWMVDYAKEFYLNGSYNECAVDEANILKTDVWRMLLLLMVIVNIVVIIYCILVISR